MAPYWKKLGENYIESKNEYYTVREVVGIPPKSYACSLYQFKKWSDKGLPTQLNTGFEQLFNQIKQKEKENKRIIIHCRSGVGKSGTLRLMYKAWKKEISSDNLLDEVIAQRALRMYTVQTQTQYNFLQAYVRSVELKKNLVPVRNGNLSQGTIIFLKNLTSWSQYNGHQAIITKPFNKEKGKYSVLLSNISKRLLIRPKFMEYNPNQEMKYKVGTMVKLYTDRGTKINAEIIEITGHTYTIKIENTTELMCLVQEQYLKPQYSTLIKSDEVSEWLKSIQLSRYINSFKEQKYNNLYLIGTFTNQQIDLMLKRVGCKAGSSTKIKIDLSNWAIGSVVVPRIKSKEYGTYLSTDDQKLDMSEKYANCSIEKIIELIENTPKISSKCFIKPSHSNTYYKLSKYLRRIEIICREMPDDFKPNEKYTEQSYLVPSERTKDEILKRILSDIQEKKKKFPKYFCIKSKDFKGIFFAITLKNMKVKIESKPMGEDWAPSNNELNLTKQFSKDNSCSVRDTIDRIYISILSLGNHDKIPDKFYVRSSTKKQYYVIWISYIAE